MTAPTTNYKTPDGTDLKDIFYLLSSSTNATQVTTDTGFLYNTGTAYQDLKQLFASYITGTKKASTTHYKTSDGKDLNEIFQNISIPPQPSGPYTITGTYTTSSDPSFNTIITFTGSSTITFSTNISSVQHIVVGGGYGGNRGTINVSTAAGGQGGGGGSVTTGNLSLSGITYEITVGAGGSGAANGVTTGQQIGQSSSIKNQSTNTVVVTANGGSSNSGGGGFGSLTGTTINGSSGSTGTNGYGGGGGGGGAGVAGGLGGAGGAGGGAGGAGGVGDTNKGTNGADGNANTGSGGGGGGGGRSSRTNGGNGGSGVVILKFNYP